jgi:hypothetical protein
LQEIFKWQRHNCPNCDWKINQYVTTIQKLPSKYQTKIYFVLREHSPT